MQHCDKCKRSTLRLSKLVVRRTPQYWELCRDCLEEVSRFISTINSQASLPDPKPDIKELGNGWVELEPDCPFTRLFKKGK